jgi:hypothetical protein
MFTIVNLVIISQLLRSVTMADSDSSVIELKDIFDPLFDCSFEEEKRTKSDLTILVSMLSNFTCP